MKRRGSLVQIREKCSRGIETADALIAELKGRRQILEAVIEASHGYYFNLDTFIGSDFKETK